MTLHEQPEVEVPEARRSRRQVMVFLLLVFVFSSVFYFLILRAHKLGAGGGVYELGLMWCPALAAVATLKLNRRSLGELGWKWPRTRYAVMSWLIPLLYATITYAIVWGAGLGGFPKHEVMRYMVRRMAISASPVVSTVVYVLLAGSFGLITNLASALGEEIGWRGFLVPELFKTMGFTGTAVFSGIVWACWHFPLIIWSSYNGGTPRWYSLICFTVTIVAISFIFSWMRLKSGSLWAAAILHASHNCYIQDILTPLTRNTGKTAWFIDEFGAVLPIVAIGFAIYFWRRRQEVVAIGPSSEPRLP